MMFRIGLPMYRILLLVVYRGMNQKHTSSLSDNEIVYHTRFDSQDCKDIYGFESGGGIYYFKTLETGYFYWPFIGYFRGKWFAW